MTEKQWYHLERPDSVESPGLVFYEDRIKANIQLLISMIDDKDRLRPHVKTHKSAEVSKLLMDAGISKFKCATIAEAEMLALCGSADVLLAYQPVGPNVDRFIRLQKQYPLTRFSCLVDNVGAAAVLAALSQSNRLKSDVFIDVNVGMDRTGILPGNVLELYAKIGQIDSLVLKGLHAYDGHIHDNDFAIRTEKASIIIDVLNHLSTEINNRLSQQPIIIAGGTPTFTVYNTQTVFDCSPGTFALWDKGYQDAFKEQQFLTAALVISRIVSLPESNLICCDLGHKAVAAEKPLDKRVAFLNAPELIPVSQSEEHLVLDAGENHPYQIGDLLYGLPYHICPTVALYENATSVSSAHADQIWNISSRKRKITI
ncbi:D-serine deaminase-like pyridoxal phosphate-dependent protein [Pedobacter sp. W3I1]|uniref:D-TA family PLP-dependent enzyme n=1 Tax=Pedobacter sp. W3I1 TaxID=3042291 RepID=UPI0027867515|nr:D-TA family PLP-dependent enzyme [Pedobacter sp. W3I1]MDQ0638399.1 D-serine deaminase-like pyridoxal phosphate-dependent protein [Pedobacter sp. W3I1]